MERFHLLEHTADIGIAALADSREGLAEQSALGLKLLLFGDSPAEPVQSGLVTAEGNTAEETLVNWLNELLFHLADEEFVPARITINYFRETGISAGIDGEDYDPDKHRFEREIKAVTHHQARVDHDNGRWESTVYLDL